MVMWIYKRDGRKEPVAFDKVTARVSQLFKIAQSHEPVLGRQGIGHI